MLALKPTQVKVRNSLALLTISLEGSFQNLQTALAHPIICGVLAFLRAGHAHIIGIPIVPESGRKWLW